MGIMTIHYLYCDECGIGEDEYYGSTRKEITSSAKADGWKFTKGKYICNFCMGENKDEE